jgi:hypothetical protein
MKTGSATHLLFNLFFLLAIGVSLVFTYYHTIILQDFEHFRDPETVPESSDFIVDIGAWVQSF